MPLPATRASDARASRSPSATRRIWRTGSWCGRAGITSMWRRRRRREADGVAHQRMCEVRGRLLQERGRDTLVAVGDRVWVRARGRRQGADRAHRRAPQRAQPPASGRVAAGRGCDPGQSRPGAGRLCRGQARTASAHARPLPGRSPRPTSCPASSASTRSTLTGLKRRRALFGVYERIGYPVLYASAKRSSRASTSCASAADRPHHRRDRAQRRGQEQPAQRHPPRPASARPATCATSWTRASTRRAQRSSDRAALRRGHLRGRHAGHPRTGPLRHRPGRTCGFYFREMAAFLHDCRYPDCTHDHEPDCAVRGRGRSRRDRRRALRELSALVARRRVRSRR